MSYLDPHILRDTFAGAQFALSELQPDGITYTAVNLTGCTVLIQFRKSHNTAVVMEWSTADASITIPNPLTGVILMKGREINIPVAGEYVYDVELTYANGTVETLFQDSWEIRNDISRRS